MNLQCLSRKIAIEKEKNRKERKKKPKLNAPHVIYNVKILPPILNNSRFVDLGVVSRFSTKKSFKT